MTFLEWWKRDPWNGESWPPNRGSKGHGLKHLANVVNIPLWEITCPLPRQFWRWCSFSQGGYIFFDGWVSSTTTARWGIQGLQRIQGPNRKLVGLCSHFRCWETTMCRCGCNLWWWWWWWWWWCFLFFEYICAKCFAVNEHAEFQVYTETQAHVSLSFCMFCRIPLTHLFSKSRIRVNRGIYKCVRGN